MVPPHSHEGTDVLPRLNVIDGGHRVRDVPVESVRRGEERRMRAERKGGRGEGIYLNPSCFSSVDHASKVQLCRVDIPYVHQIKNNDITTPAIPVPSCY